MSQSIEKIDRIINKISLILEKNLKLEEEIKRLKKNLSEVEKNREHLLAQKEAAEQELQRVKLAKSVEVSSEEKNLMKKELKSYIKEIDKCMALLNK